MTDLVAADEHAPELASLSNDALRAELANCLSLTAKALMRAAEIWTELQRRGIDMTALRSGLGAYLPRVARGELAAEAVVTFAGQRMLLQHMAGMPLGEQRRYAAGELIMIAERDENGQIIGVERRLAELSGREVLLAMSEGRVRPLKEQTSTLIRQVAKPTVQRRQAGSVAKVFARDGLVHVGRTRLEPLDLAPALKALGFAIVKIDKG